MVDVDYKKIINWWKGFLKFLGFLFLLFNTLLVITIYNFGYDMYIERNSSDINQELPLSTVNTVFTDVAGLLGVQLSHQEEDKIDFNLQRTMPHKYTQMGPALAVADVNGDGLDDFYVGGAAKQAGTLHLQQADGTFSMGINLKKEDMQPEDMGSLFFDADNDGDQDLYVASGSYEYIDNPEANQDRLYLNDGSGNFLQAPDALPSFQSVSSAVKAADFDPDGDLDLFVGGRVVPGAYPRPADSYLLSNDGGAFTDVTAELLPELKAFGLVSDALWTDFDQDGRVDLILAAEWKPLSFFRNTPEGFVNVTETTGISDKVGWWNSLTAGDFDKDGDTDYIAGNLGLNSSYQASDEYPLSVYAKDFDDNGGYDAIMVKYIKDRSGEMRPYPMHSLDVMLSQMIGFKRRFQKYEEFGRATIDSLLNDEMLEGAIVYHANYMKSSYLENLGEGKFAIRALPMAAQIAPLYGMLSRDVDQDGNLDLLLVGNNYGTEVFTGRLDAFKGLYMRGDGQGSFEPLSLSKSGFYVPGDAKALVEMKGRQDVTVYLASQNQDSLVVMQQKAPQAGGHMLALQPQDAWAIATLADGSEQRMEFYYGEGYLSQSGRKIQLSPQVTAIRIYDYQGNERVVEPGKETY